MEDIILFYAENNVDPKFDHVYYRNKYPETNGYYQPFCKLNGISEQARLYFHWHLYGSKADYDMFKPDVTKALESIENQENIGDVINKNKDLIHELTNRKIDINPKLQSRAGVIYCFNKDFTEGFFVSIGSFVLNNQTIIDQIDFYIYVDETVRCIESNVIEFLDKLKINYNIVYVETILNDTDTNLDELKEDYGFKCYIKLDKSAYYRIYALRHLLSNHGNASRYSKLLYLDSDTVVNSNLFHLFYQHNEAILYAQRDTIIDLVELSISHNNLGDYFNSGVMLFNIDGKNINLVRGRIRDCIDIIGNDQESLFYHDQCALNKAFNNCWYKLDQSYNVLKKSLDYGKILHYTTSPKIWHSDYTFDQSSTFHQTWFMYNRIIRAIWHSQQ